ncbi:5-methylcytosine-specific restriction protein B [Knoellia remsis]|uniref:5-methylcytosine-specific restriction protein B n=1 Tax=Knoellia remsis TaxID=407159 RepID=A0A2T0UGS9_9MICO|nr:AAA family ATPase [Knoellia remsis]PRY57150.1 5-methylcytosine-specific restriction protein B [Knoellia remsis]
MSPFPTVGKISFTKYTQPDEAIAKLATLEPGVTTAGEVEALLDNGGSTPKELYNDIIRYEPPVVSDSDSSRSGVVLDDELLRACREGRPEAGLLLWCALNIADRRLDRITRTILTDPTGRLRPEMINRVKLQEALSTEATSTGQTDFPHDDKSTTNILRLTDKCGLLVPRQRGASIIGLERTLPTRQAVPPLITMLGEKLAQYQLTPTDGAGVDFALGIGANHWLNLTANEFRVAAAGDAGEVRPTSQRGPLPDDLTELADLLHRRRQVVLQGPPGVGKTYLARRYIDWATADRAEESRLQGILSDLPANERRPEDIAAEILRRGLTTVWDIVQFHPGYDYTDFVRALVAEPVDGGVAFTPRHKIFSLMAAVGQELDALDSNIEPVLILDEINRGDIANIFGELLYALEYRDEPVATPYTVDGHASITVPASLALIGTMNTADRSIAVIDYALRRRFVFLDLPATPGPISAHASYSTDSVKQAAMHLFKVTEYALAATSPGLRVGPSYYLVDADDEADGLEKLAARYVYEVLPLLREYALEGELDEANLSALTSPLGLDRNLTQREAVASLATILKALATLPPASPTAASEDDMSDTGGLGEKTQESESDSATENGDLAETGASEAH